MTLKTTQLRDAIVFALVAGATTLAGTGLAFAQDTAAPAQEEQEATELDRITVTGTRIQSQAITASSPVAEINEEEFVATGSTRVDDLVNQMPQMAPYFDSFANNGATGYPTASLRNLGPQRTLTLVNGLRVTPGTNLVPDLSQIPAALVKRVDILTGGASAVYGSDAVAGVVNFILDTEFEGFSINLGYSAYQHDNDNEYMQGLQDRRGFTYPTGNSGFDGKSRNIDIVWGSQFADGAGHASAWLTWRRNDPLFQGERDYSSCALNAAGTACGGSATAPKPNFFVYDQNVGGNGAYLGFANIGPDGSWRRGLDDVYNYAPINYYQRPEDRINFGSSLKYEINEHFRPFVELMFTQRKNSIQVAESGTFFADALEFDCTDPLIGTLCADVGLDPTGPITVYVGKRNVEGGPRHFEQNDSTYRAVAGVEGALDDNWSYNISTIFGRTQGNNLGTGDFLADRVVQALRGCPAGSFDGCVPYNVWVPGGVTADAAAALQGTSVDLYNTSITSVVGYVTGDLGFSLPTADGNPISMVVGTEWRKETFSQDFDSNSQAGNFTGAGGPALPLAGQTEVTEVFLEAAVPVLRDAGFVTSFDLDLGYRLSDYDLSGRANTFKVGFNGAFAEMFRVRGGYNKAIRAPNIDNLFAQQQIALWSGVDPCAGPTPAFTLAQCQNTGVTADQYGNIPESPASQYNQFVGGNRDLQPEQAETYTIGFAMTPVRGLEVAVDYYDIKIEETIATIGASRILASCGTSGVEFLCERVNRNPVTGDLWLGNDLATSGYIENLPSNFGNRRVRGIDLNLGYRWNMFGGFASAAFVGSRMLEDEHDPLPGIPTEIYDCTGTINADCQQPEWRHIASLRYGRDFYSVNLRWRHTGSMDYINTNGTPATVDRLLINNGNKLDSYDFFDLSGTFQVGQYASLTVGVNNFLDKEPPLVGASLALNANSPGGYDQAGRYFFTSLNLTF
jgi:iron complex outermembrane receptor protein